MAAKGGIHRTSNREFRRANHPRPPCRDAASFLPMDHALPHPRPRQTELRRSCWAQLKKPDRTGPCRGQDRRAPKLESSGRTHQPHGKITAPACSGPQYSNHGMQRPAAPPPKPNRAPSSTWRQARPPSTSMPKDDRPARGARPAFKRNGDCCAGGQDQGWR